MSDWTPPSGEVPGGAPDPTPPGPPTPGPGWPGPAAPYGAPGGYGAWAPPPQAPKPGVVALRPLSLADILDGSIAYVRREPRTVFGIAAVLSLILLVLNFFSLLGTFRSLDVSTTSTGAEDSLGIGDVGTSVAMLVEAVLSVPVGVVATGLLTTVVGRAVLGRTTSIGEAWSTARPLLWRLLGVTVLIALIVGGIGVGAIVLAVLLGVLVGQASVSAGVLLGVLVGAAGLVAAVWMANRLQLAPAALVLERSRVTTALRRSTALVRGSWWRVFGISLLAQVIASIISQVLTVPFTLVGTVLSVAFPENGNFWWITLAAVSLGTFVATVVTMPFTAGVTALLYIDRRIRREALDIELTRAAAGAR